ncbi:hypothetical protein AA16373_1272 [Komagataeibacter swingsii DSM 16373]|nr:hypothetical protein AA16373_1272 [Komagataeibacter swingsii DSM 16373]
MQVMACLPRSFIQALSARNLRWTVGIPRHQKVYSADVELVFPASKRWPIPDASGTGRSQDITSKIPVRQTTKAFAGP